MDISHEPEQVKPGSEEAYVCADCGMELPQPVCVFASGLKVVEIGGGAGFVPDDGTPGSVSCTSPAAQQRRELADKVEQIEEVAPAAPELSPGETVKEAHPLTDIERMANVQSFQNFVRMREMTGPQEKQ